jgi:hypothetical protein
MSDYADLNRLGALLADVHGIPWTNIPEGIPLEPGRGRLVAGMSGGKPGDPSASIDYEVHEDGTVTCTQGYEAIVGNGHITGFRVLTDAT